MVEFLLYVLHLVESWGYLGIFVMTFLESTFLPIPAEITIVPAGYLISEGKMGFLMVIICSVLGTIGGSLFNYFIARRYGRSLFLNYGKYFLITPEHLKAIEYFFARHGAISTFTGRILPGIKHFISFPAGLAKMNISRFIIYTAAGGTIWNTILTTLGYYLGQNQGLLKNYIKHINILIIVGLSVFIAWKWWKQRNNTTNKE